MSTRSQWDQFFEQVYLSSMYGEVPRIGHVYLYGSISSILGGLTIGGEGESIAKSGTKLVVISYFDLPCGGETYEILEVVQNAKNWFMRAHDLIPVIGEVPRVIRNPSLTVEFDNSAALEAFGVWLARNEHDFLEHWAGDKANNPESKKVKFSYTVPPHRGFLDGNVISITTENQN